VLWISAAIEVVVAEPLTFAARAGRLARRRAFASRDVA
jgi:hypothetical protein